MKQRFTVWDVVAIVVAILGALFLASATWRWLARLGIPITR